MKLNAITLSEALPNGNEPPKEFRIFSFGKIETSKGTFVFDQESAKSVLAAWRDHATELSMDYEHAALQDAGEIATGAPAAAWFKLELRDDGLYAVDVRWTPRATEYLTGKEYRFFSPAFTTDKKGRIQRLINIALTNLPATKGLEPLVAAKDQLMNEELQKALEALQASIKEIADRVSALEKDESGEDKPEESKDDEPKDGEKKDEPKDGEKTEETKDDESEEKQTRSDLGSEVVSLTGKSGSKASAVLLKWKAAAEELPTVKAELVALKAKQTEAEVVALVDSAIKSGRLPPAKREVALKIGRKDREQLTDYIALTDPSPVFKKNVEPPTDQITLTDDEKSAARTSGISESAMLARKQARAAK